MDFMIWIWLGVAVLSAVVEFFTLKTFAIWFAIGAVVPLILAAATTIGWEIQLALFVAISAVSVILLRALVLKLKSRNVKETPQEPDVEIIIDDDEDKNKNQ